MTDGLHWALVAHGVDPPSGVVAGFAAGSTRIRRASRVPGGGGSPAPRGRAMRRFGSRTDSLTDTRSRVSCPGTAITGGAGAGGAAGAIEAGPSAAGARTDTAAGAGATDPVGAAAFVDRKGGGGGGREVAGR